MKRAFLTSARRRLRQRGVAVITALLLTTLAVTIVASLFWQQQVQVRSMENQRLHLQTKWIMRGALDWVALVLRQDGMDHGNYTSLDQVWATPVAETRLDQYIDRERVAGEVFDATLSGYILDASSRYNLANLASSQHVVPEQVVIFSRLLRNLGLDPQLATRAAKFVAEGQTQPRIDAPPDGTPPPGNPSGGTPSSGTPSGETGQNGAQSGAQSGAASRGGVPNGTAAGTASGGAGSGPVPMGLLELNDLLAVPGFTLAVVDKLRDFVIVLPESTPVNVNTAAPEVLAAVIKDFSVGQANVIVAQRKRAAWRDIAQFKTELMDTTGKSFDDGTLDVKSTYFLVRSQVRLDRAALNAEALVSRQLDPRRTTSVLWVRQN